MTKEDRKLLLKDLCARLPYGVKMWYKYKTWHCEMFATSIGLTDGKIALSSKLNKEGDWYPIEEAGEILIKPYLRPMSSMTEEERAEFYDVGGLMSHKVETDTYVLIAFSPEAYDYLNAHHFDYHGLIPMSLALEAPKGMYNTNKKEK